VCLKLNFRNNLFSIKILIRLTNSTKNRRYKKKHNTDLLLYCAWKNNQRELKVEDFPATHLDYRKDISPSFIVNSPNSEVNAIEFNHRAYQYSRILFSQNVQWKFTFTQAKTNRLAQCLFQFRECLKWSMKLINELTTDSVHNEK
jgi:hypothetical protein